MRRHLKGVRPAVLTVGGWFDAEDLFGTLSTFRAVESGGPGSFNGLVMGPWFHGGWSRGDGASLGAVDFHSKTAEYYREQIKKKLNLKSAAELTHYATSWVQREAVK